MFIVSRKIAEAPERITALQTDYVAAWNQESGTTDKMQGFSPSALTHFINRLYRKLKPIIPWRICEWGERRHKLKTHYTLVKDFANLQKNY
jgi:hypothetical protein